MTQDMLSTPDWSDAVANRPLALDGLLQPRAITVVGASPNGQITHHILRNLENRSIRWDRPVHLVNPKYSRIFDRPCIGSTAEIDGSPGLVYLLVPPEQCLEAVRGLRELPDGVVLYQEPSQHRNGYEAALAAWGRKYGIPVLGAQSTGVVSVSAGLLGLLVTVIEDIPAGGVAVLSQSGGVVGGVVKYLAEKSIGIHSALSYGTASMLAPEELGTWLLERDEVRLLGIYADGVSDPSALATLLRSAERVSKPVVLLVGGATSAGHRAAVSHSGAAATPRRIVEGIVDQYNAVLVDTLDAFVWSIAALDAIRYARPTAPAVALFTDSGGGGVTMADAVAGAGVPLPDPVRDTQDRIGAVAGTNWNPFDFGSRTLGQISDQAGFVTALGSDPRFGVCAYASTQGIPIAEQAVQIRQIDQFIDAAIDVDKIPFIASAFPFADRLENRTITNRAVIGLGSIESAAKLRAITIWGRSSDQTPEPATPAPSSSDSGERVGVGPAAATALAISGQAAIDYMRRLPLLWPAQYEIGSLADLDSIEASFPVALKAEAGLGHRAAAGGVLLGISTPDDLRNGAAYLLGRFGGRVSVSTFIAHSRELFVGAVRSGGDVVVMLGPGGGLAEMADSRLMPVTRIQAITLASRHAPDRADQLGDLLLTLGQWVADEPWINAVDLNPLIAVDNGIMALDAKIHGSPPKTDRIHTSHERA